MLLDPLISAGARAVPRARAGRPRRAGGRRAELVTVCHRFGPARGGRLCCVPGQESRQGGRVPAAGEEHGGRQIKKKINQSGGRAGARCATDQAGRRAWIRKKAGRARRVWRVPACCAVCCCDLPAPAPLHGMPPGCFSRFPGAVLCAAPEGSDSPLYRVVLYV